MASYKNSFFLSSEDTSFRSHFNINTAFTNQILTTTQCHVQCGHGTLGNEPISVLSTISNVTTRCIQLGILPNFIVDPSGRICIVLQPTHFQNFVFLVHGSGDSSSGSGDSSSGYRGSGDSSFKITTYKKTGYELTFKKWCNTRSSSGGISATVSGENMKNSVPCASGQIPKFRQWYNTTISNGLKLDDKIDSGIIKAYFAFRKEEQNKVVKKPFSLMSASLC